MNARDVDPTNLAALDYPYPVNLEALVQSYGYPILAIGTFLEGETIVVIAGFLAHRGYLHLPWVVVVAFLASFASDQLCFLIGRVKGLAWVEARPHWHARAERIRTLLARHGIPVVLGFRFAYGFRNVTPFIIGATGFRVRSFMTLNAVGALIWSLVVGSAGYCFGQAVESVIDDVKKYEMHLLAVCALGGLTAWTVLWLRRRRGERSRLAAAGPIAARAVNPANTIASGERFGRSDNPA
jgi:membrane protein DedA with SNARE-associated domain